MIFQREFHQETGTPSCFRGAPGGQRSLKNSFCWGFDSPLLFPAFFHLVPLSFVKLSHRPSAVSVSHGSSECADALVVGTRDYRLRRIR